MDVAGGETFCDVDPTPYHVMRVLPSASSLMIQSTFESCRGSFCGGFSALCAPLKPMSTPAVIANRIIECTFCSSVPLSVLTDATEMPTSTLPAFRNTDTVYFNTDSIKMKNFAALLREADENSKLETQVEKKAVELLHLRNVLNFLRKHYDQHLKHNDTLACNVRKTTNPSKELRGEKQSGKANERALRCLYAILQSFVDINFDHSH